MSQEVQPIVNAGVSRKRLSRNAQNSILKAAKAWVRQDSAAAIEVDWPGVAAFFRQRMEDYGLSYKGLSELSGVPLRTVYAVLREHAHTPIKGHFVTPNLATLLVLANALDIRPTFFAPRPAQKWVNRARKRKELLAEKAAKAAS